MIRKEFQQWLDQFPEDTIIEVGVQNAPLMYCPYGSVSVVNFVGKEYEDFEYTDLTDNKLVEPSQPYYKKRYLLLGQFD